MFVRSLVLVLALLVGFGSTEAVAKDVVLVKLREPAAKPAPKKTTVRAKKQPVRRAKAVAKSKPKPKKKSTSKKTEAEPVRSMP
jgi:hypothetical protein